MSSVVDTLVEMGFSKQKAEIAVAKTASQDLQVVMDWIISHEDELESLTSSISDSVPVSAPVEVEQPANVSTSENNVEMAPVEGSEEPSPIAKSIRCDDCQKLFKSNEEVEFHAAKSGQSNFSESTEEKKPLTDAEKKEQLAKIEAKLRQRRLEREAREKEEPLLREKNRINNFSESTEEKKPLTDAEKKEQLAKIEAKLRQRRLEREAREKEEALLREKNRIKSGKEMLEAKKRHEELEMKKIIEQRKREKEEERLAKQRVRDQIEQDKLARKAKFSGAASEPPVAPPVTTPAATPRPAVNYTEIRLQIKLPDGSGLTQTFGAKEPLSSVRLFVEMSQKVNETSFSLMRSYPRKIWHLLLCSL
ncbi:unnamed protein product [Phaedon cochleariae]|uniref:UBX domain-containing protein 1 n=1 Tax=Phaedon cochleariae TaxID=80249 RepID=A0A9N9SHJ3_PHACE|nr:unnamed protein product [Phaedon cochleariae]